MALFFRLEFGKARFPALTNSSEEVVEGLIQVAEGFLGGTLGDLIHPGKFGLFKAIQFPMQVNGRGCFARFGIFSDFTLEAPVVGEAGATSVFATEGLLGFVQFQFGFVGPMNP